MRFFRYSFFGLVALILVFLAATIGRIVWYFETRYAEGYSESSFDRVEEGMTEDQVLNLLGEPLRKYPESLERQVEYWHYSEQANPTSSYFERIVLFSSDGIVLRKIAEIYID